MINLLPPEQKKELLLKKKIHLIIVLGSVFTIFIICLSLILLSLKFYLLITIYSMEFQTANTKDLLKLTEAKKEITEYNFKINNLKSFYENQLFFNEMLRSTLEVDIPKGVYIIYILSEKNNNEIETTIYGFSDLRENLILFKDNIDKSNIIKSPYFSPDSWTKTSNINFYLTFKYEKQK